MVVTVMTRLVEKRNFSAFGVPLMAELATGQFFLSQLIPITKVKILTQSLGLWFYLRPFDDRISACRGPAMDYNYVYRLWCW